MDLQALRAEFPVLERVSYLNTGSIGPVPRAAAEAARADIEEQERAGRGSKAEFERGIEIGERLRVLVATCIGATPEEVALTGATTDGVNAVVGGLDLEAGDEIVTSDEEHPGLLAPLARAVRRNGVTLRTVPFTELAAAITGRTRLVACSHVSWLNGQVVDTAALAAAPAPVLLDGAQGLGAVAVDVGALGCDFYAASGQKWLCGPVGSGYLWVHPDRIDELEPIAPGYGSLATPGQALTSAPRPGAARFDSGMPPSHHAAWSLAALELLVHYGLGDLQQRATSLAGELATALAAQGARVAPRDNSTLVSWESEDNEADSLRLLGAGIVVRHLPGTPYVRASVGPWTSREEIEQLVEWAVLGSNQ